MGPTFTGVAIALLVLAAVPARFGLKDEQVPEGLLGQVFHPFRSGPRLTTTNL